MEAKNNELQSNLLKNYNARKSKGPKAEDLNLDQVSAGSDSEDTELNSNYTEDVEDNVA